MYVAKAEQIAQKLRCWCHQPCIDVIWRCPQEVSRLLTATAAGGHHTIAGAGTT